jgi:hypothetical protein
MGMAKKPRIELDVEAGQAARKDNDVVEVPAEINVVMTPPRALINALDKSEGALCGQRYALTWDTGPWKGLPVTGYCAEPRCITEGLCTGTRFVPHIDQYTDLNPDNKNRRRRKLDKDEAVAAVRQFAHRAAVETGRDEDRSDKEILGFIKMVWIKTINAIRGDGDWRR